MGLTPLLAGSLCAFLIHVFRASDLQYVRQDLSDDFERVLAIFKQLSLRVIIDYDVVFSAIFLGLDLLNFGLPDCFHHTNFIARRRCNSLLEIIDIVFNLSNFCLGF